MHNYKKELQLSLKTNNTQNFHKIELYGSQTTKDLKKPHSSRWVGGTETRRQGGEVRRLGVVQRGGGSGGMGTGGPTFTWGGYKSGGIAWEQMIPSPRPDHITQGPELGR